MISRGITEGSFLNCRGDLPFLPLAREVGIEGLSKGDGMG